jgi:hypothetical protein
MSTTSGFGSGLGAIIGSSLGAEDLNRGLNNINNTAGGFRGAVEPYNEFGQSFLNPTAGAIGNINAVAGSDPNLNFNTFMKNYQTSPGAAYDIDVANKAQNSSAAASGSLLSGANERALATTDTGIANKYANEAYSNYLAGNNQQFGQLESALGNMFKAIGVGTTATGQEAGVDTGQMNAQASIAQAQAKNDQSKGGGIGSLFGGIGSMFAF